MRRQDSYIDYNINAIQSEMLLPLFLSRNNNYGYTKSTLVL
jgi:hypothetical protein